MKHFNNLYTNIISELTDNRIKYFNTYKEARDFLNKNYNGHGTIYDINGEIYENCRCIKSVHDQLNIPKVIVNMPLDDIKKERENELNKFFNQKNNKII